MVPVDTAICAGISAIINLSSSISGTSYTWVATQTGGVTGIQNCTSQPTPCGNQINQVLGLNPNTWTPGIATYTITPSYDNCQGIPGDTSIMVKPLPNVSFLPASTAICHGGTTQIQLSTSIQTGATFAWTASQIQGSVTGFSGGTGNTITQILFNTGYTSGIVRYSVVATAAGCQGNEFTYDVTVYPVPDVSNNPMNKSICSNTSTAIPLVSNVTGTSFSWTASSQQPFIAGYGPGAGPAINQTLTNSGNVNGTVTYVITASANGCSGPDTNYQVTVHPVPVASVNTSQQEICSGSPTTPVILSSNVTGTTFSWTGVASAPGITGFTANGSGTPIPSQTNIISSLTTQGTVTYTVNLTANGCTGTSATHTITVNPSPGVTNTPLQQTICSGTQSQQVNLTSNVPGTTFTWNAVAPASITGFTPNGGDIIPPQTLFSTAVTPQSVTYRIVPNFTGTTSCPGDTTDYLITVNPKPQVTSILFDSVCSDNLFSYTITSSVANCTFTWSRATVPGISNPAVNGSTSQILEILHNTTFTDINVGYQLIATGPGIPACQSQPAQLIVRVKDYFVDAGDSIEIPHGISTDLSGAASGGGGNPYYTWQPSSMIQTGLHTLSPHTKNIYQDTTFYLVVTDQSMTNCTKTDSVRITLNGSALAVNPFMDPDYVCPGDSAQLFANPSGGSGVYVSFTWVSDPPGNPIWTSTEENPWVTPMAPTTYTVTVNDGYNQAYGSTSNTIKPPPAIHSITGGGSYCAGGSGVVIGMGNTTLGDVYTLIDPNGGGGATISGSGSAMSFGTFTTPGVYTATATSTSTPQCTSVMSGSATITIIPIPVQFSVTGGGSYSQGGSGVEIGLSGSQLGIEYELVYNDTIVIPPRIQGTGDDISFGNQTLGGTYKVIAYTLTNPVCTIQMLDSAVVIVNPWPTVYTLMGGGEVCADDSTGVPIWLEDSEIGITYRLFRNGTQYGDTVVGTDDSLFFTYSNKPGTYWATGTNQITGLMKPMDDTLTILVNPLPVVFVMGSYGDNCPGTEIMLNGSQPGANYELQVNQNPVGIMTGTGSVLNFGPVTNPGIYRIRAFFVLTGCDTLMDNPITINPSPEVYNIRPVGVSCAGDTISLTGSQLGIKYQLQRDGSFNVGSPRDGTGDTLVFGPQFVPGDYSILAFNPQTNCNILMNGVANLNPLPDPYSVVPSGDTCAGTSVGLSGSQPGVKYILKRDTLWLDTLNGTSQPIEFGPQTVPGIYTIVGYDTTTYKFCSNQMLGATVILSNPIAYQIIPMGYACAFDNIGLVHSDTGVIYQLIRNGSQNIGDPIAGTGDTIWFGIQVLPGTYHVIGRALSNNCWGDMTGTAILTANPSQFTIIPAGDTCSGTSIGLNGSHIGANYILLLDGVPQDTIQGTGSILSFGPQWLGGTYEIWAVNTTPDSCDAMMFGSTVIHQLPIDYSVIPGGISCAGDSVGLSDSDTGIVYQLLRNDVPLVGVLQSGTGFPINFGPQILPGIYKVIGTTQEADCYTMMNDSANLIPIPTIYTLVPQGDTCENSIIELNGSQIGVTYRLFRDTIHFVEQKAGTGLALLFGPLAASGIYHIIAYNSSADSCHAWMAGSITIHPNPEIYNIIPSGTICGGDTIRLNYSQLGIQYYLKKNNSIIDTLPGTNSMLNFGYYNIPGIYTMIAQNPSSPHCWSAMNGSLTIDTLPVLYTLIPNNDTCEKIPIGLNGSQQGVNYILRENGWPVETLAGTGNTIFFSYVTTPATYTVLAIKTGSSGCSRLMNGSCVIHPLPQPYDLMPAGVNCELTEVWLYDSQNGVNYWLIRNGLELSPWILGDGDSITFGLQPAGVYHAIGRYQNTLCAELMAGTVIVSPQPASFAGNDTSVCYGYSINLTGSATSYSTVQWISRGDGIFTASDSLETGYIPGNQDLLAGSVWLIFSVTGTDTCAYYVVKDSLLLTIDPLPVVNAGSDQATCDTTPADITGNAQYYSTVLWTTSGDGQFTPTNQPITTYAPGLQDVQNGVVTLTLTAYGNLACTDTVFDSMILSIDPMPIANAGPDDTICENDSYTLNGSLSNSNSSLWSTLGSGSFNDPTFLNATYTPSPSDVAAGSVELILTANGVQTCSAVSALDTMILFFGLIPVIDAGPDTTICANQSYTLSQATAQYETSVLWSTVGDGQFSDPDSLNPTYAPGVADTANGFVLLVLQATGSGHCSNETITDTMILSFHSAPVAFAGADLNGCPNESLPVSGNAYNYSNSLWETTGDGFFDDSTSLTTIYNPGAGDITMGFVHLILTVNGTAECFAETDTDTTHVIFTTLPTAFLSGYDTICEGDTAYLQLSLTGTPSWTIQLFDGLNTATVAGIDTTPFLLPVVPGVSVSYSLTGVSDQYCNGELFSGTAVVMVNPTPDQFQITASNGGIYCEGGPGVTIGIDGSQQGFEYQLLLNNQPIGLIHIGTGDTLVFGTFTLTGIYTVKANNPSTTCSIVFPDSITVFVLPIPDVNFTADSSCFGDSTYFFLTGPDVGEIASWTWNFGDGVWATYYTPVNPVHAFYGAGIYNVIMNALDTNGCNKTVSHLISVSSPPFANFGYTPTPCVNIPTFFTDYSVSMNSDYLAQWKWEFGDGSDTTIYWPDYPNVSHIYTTAGLKTVVLSVTTNGGCEDTISHGIMVYPNPLANFTFSTIRCAGESVQFTDQSQTNGGGTIIGWNWNFDDPGSGSNNTSTAQHPTHTFNVPGIYDILLIVSNLTGCLDTIVKPVTISDTPVADFHSDTACVGNPTYFTDLSTTSQGIIVSWDWNFGDGSPHWYTPNAVHTYSNSGVYTASLTVTNSFGCSDVISKQVIVSNGPTAGFITTNENCSGSAVSFIDQSIPYQGYILTWIWDFGDGNTVTINFPNPQNVDHIYALPGIYIVVLTIQTSDSCTDSYSQPVTIEPKPSADFIYPEVTCEDFGIQFTDQSQSNGPGQVTTWNWNFGDPTSGMNNTSTLQNPIHTFLNAGSYDVTLMINTLFGCKDTVMKSVPINSKPTVLFTADTVCLGDSTTFTDFSTTGSGTNTAWYWQFGDGGFSYLHNPKHLYASTGIYQVTLTVTNSVNCDHDTTINVLVRDLPLAMFYSINNCLGTLSYFYNQSSTYSGVITNWYWDFGDGTTSTLPDPVHLYDSATTYEVELTVTNSFGCQNSIVQEHTVYENPTAAFTYINSYCPAGQVAFTENCTAYGTNIAGWNWIFENGSGSYLPNPVYTFSSYDRTYEVTLIVEDLNGCIDTVQQNVYVHPAFEFTFTTENECVGQPTKFTPVNLAQGDSLLSIVWRFGDPSSGTNNYSAQYSPTHIYSTPGSYWIRMKAINSDYCIDSIFKEIFIHQGPLADFSFDSLPHCDDTTMVFKNLSLGNGVTIDSILWDFGDGITQLQIPPFPYSTAHKFPEFGNFNISLTVFSATCDVQVFKSVIISCISASIEQPDTLFCSSEDALFIDNSNPVNLISTWYWDFGDGYDTTYSNYNDSILHHFSIPDLYIVTLVISSPTSSGSFVYDSVRVTVNIKPGPIADFYASPVCYMDTTQFLNLSIGNGVNIHSIHWNFGDPASGGNNFSTESHPRHFYNRAGTFYPTLLISNDNGCQASIVKEIIVHKLPEANISTNLSCARHNTYFSDNSSPGDTILSNWFWIFGDPQTILDTSTQQHPAYNYYHPGKYSIFLRAGDDFGCYDTAYLQHIVLPSPTSAFTMEENIDGIPGRIQLINHSLNAVSYEWDYGDGFREFIEEPGPHEYKEEGNYLIKLITWAEDLCADTSFYQLDLIFKGLYIPNAFSPTNVNPNSKYFKPKGVNLKIYHIQIFDIWGTLLWESSALDNSGRPKEHWDGTYHGNLMPQGVYMWKASATFVDGSSWEGNETIDGKPSRIGTVALIR
jgi:PKD repeat protein